MSAGIQHLLRGGRESNRVGETRVDKIETDKFNSIVERISGVNPSKLAAEATGKPMVESQAEPAPVHAMYGAGPAADLAAARRGGGDNSQVEFLARKVAQLEQKLAQYEVFNGNDNDVVVTTNRSAQSPSNRGPDSQVFARDIDPKKAKTKDPADGKPDKPKAAKTPEGQMPAEHTNILGISMTEWREMAGLKAPAVDLTARAPVQESYEDEVDGDETPEAEATDDTSDELTTEQSLWAEFLTKYNTTPEAMVEFVEAAERNKDVEALVAVQDLEDEFEESIKADQDMGAMWAEWLEARELSVETFDALVAAAETDEDMEPLRELQAMFEAQLAVKTGDGSARSFKPSEIHEPGKKPVAATSVVRSGGDIKPSRKGNFSLPASMRKKMGLPAEEDQEGVDEEDTFECDSDETGGPDMKHPGWAKAMKRLKTRRKS